MEGFAKGERALSTREYEKNMDAARSGIGSQAQPATRQPTQQVRQPTQIEALTRDLTQVANRLNLFNDNVEQKLEMFHPSDLNGAKNTPEKVQNDLAPPDGTMAALHYQGNRLHIEVERYGRLWERLATII